jgi:hypothetical protein
MGRNDVARSEDFYKGLHMDSSIHALPTKSEENAGWPKNLQGRTRGRGFKT